MLLKFFTSMSGRVPGTRIRTDRQSLKFGLAGLYKDAAVFATWMHILVACNDYDTSGAIGIGAGTVISTTLLLGR